MQNYKNLVDVINDKSSIDDKGITFITSDKDESYVSYKELYTKSHLILHYLHTRGIKKGDEVVFQIEDPKNFIYLFWACILGGIISVPVTIGNNSEHRLKLFRIWGLLKNPYLLIDKQALVSLEKFTYSNNLDDNIHQMKNRIVLVEEIECTIEPKSIYKPISDDIAFIQFSSGSTGEPKGVILTHENLLTNINSIIVAAKITSYDSSLNWMPLTHDMGLIGFHLTPLIANINQYIMPTTLFVRRPNLWLKKACEHKATLLASPNFGYKHFLHFFDAETSKDLDLSFIRLIVNGGEPISAELAIRFLDIMGNYGLKRNSMFPVYGMAEASLAISFPPVEEEFTYINLEREFVSTGENIVEVVGSISDKNITLVDEGYPINDCYVRICDKENNELGEYIIGRIQIKGKNVTKGYYNNIEATQKVLMSGGWLNTGDLGFIRNGRLVVTDREKDIIFVNGQNFYLQDIERVTEKIEGIEIEQVAACGVFNKEKHTEEVILFIVFKKKIEEFVPIALDIKNSVSTLMGLKLKEVIPIKKFPKTTSGKIQRYKLTERYMNGEFSSLVYQLESLLSEKNREKTIDVIQGEIENKLLKICSKILGTEKIGKYDNFYDMGFDSILIMELRNMIEKEYLAKVSAIDLFTYTTISKLAEFIKTQEPDIIDDKRDTSNLHEEKLFSISDNDIAIIGMCAELPMANNVNEFWNNLINGVDCVCDLPESRRKDVDSYLRYINKDKKIQYPKGAYLQEIDKFDSVFFHISPKQAELMDPYQRIFLETAWGVIEDAGYGGQKLRGTETGVYVGLGDESGYSKMVSDVEYFLTDNVEPLSGGTAVIGNLKSIIASQISYLMDLKGPSVVIDTSCSASLVAVHFACQSIRNGECEQAIAGGIRIVSLPLEATLSIGIESKSARSKTFDNSSDGTGIGEGAIAILLKPLDRAIRDRDNIYAVIKGSAVNQNGSSIGILAPNMDAQEKVITKAWRNSRVNPETITYIEAHGTGTTLGDPIEVAAIQKAFAQFTDRKQFCAIGSVKTNIGHLYQAAGIAGLVKVALALKYKQLPPTIHFNKPNRHINFEESSVYINDKLANWKSNGYPLRCGVSSFGFSGTNCHIVLEQTPEIKEELKPSDLSPEIFTLSAKSEEALKQLVKNYYDFFSSELSIHLRDICYTANTGRGHFTHRLAIIVQDKSDIREKIKLLLETSFTGINTQGIFYGQHKAFTQESTNLSNLAAEKMKQLLLHDKKEQKVLEEICRLYIKGADIQWEELYKEYNPRKVSLPIYPFERKRCWIHIPESEHKQEYSVLKESENYYALRWKVEEIGDGKSYINDGIILILKDDKKIGDQVAKRLRNEGRDIVEVEFGKVYEKINENKFIISGTREDYEKVLSKIRVDNLSHIVHLLSITQEEEVKDIKQLEHSLKRGVFSLFHLIKMLFKGNANKKVNITLISDFVDEVNGEEKRVCPENAPLFGLGKTLQVEYPNIRCRCIDIDEFTNANDIIAEIHEGSDIHHVAYRGGKRYVGEFGEVNIEGVSNKETIIKKYGVYVITGGTGGIGLEIAKYLASKGKVKLALVNRTKMPERERWNEILSKKEDAKLCKKIESIKEIESKGCEIICYSADVSKLDEMERVINELKERYGKINGIVHGAGLIGGELVIGRNEEDFRAVLLPKIQGTWVLDKLTQLDKLDFFILLSSASTLFAVPGLGDYIAANSYLDSYSAYRNKQGKRTLAINWPIWKETGIAEDSGFISDSIFKAITTEQAISKMDRVINKDIRRVLIGEINYESKMLYQSGKIYTMLAQEISSKLRKVDKPVITECKDNEEFELEGRENQEYTEIEKIVAQTYSKVLGFKEINIYNTVFELGIDSIQGLRIVNILNSKMDVHIKITDLFKCLTIEKLSRYLEQVERTNAYALLQPVEQNEYYITSSAQKRMYFLSMLESQSTNYNISGCLIIKGVIEQQLVEDIFKSLIERHEALRTSFEIVDGELVQKIHKEIDFHINYLEVAEENIEDIAEGFIKPFNLSKAPLIRAGLAKLSEHKHILLLDMHHIISDGTSIAVLIHEFANVYEKKKLAELKVQYKDFSVWQNKILKTEVLKRQEEYWLDVFKGELPILDMPLDYPRPPIKSSEGDRITFTAGKELTTRIRDFARKSEVTIYMLLLATYNVLLAKYTGQEDIILGLPIEGRPHETLENIVGVFVNTIPMRNYPELTTSFIEFLKAVKENLLRAFENQDYQFEQLVSSLNLQRDLSRNPLFDSMFTMQNSSMTTIMSEKLEFMPYELEAKVSKFDISLEIKEMDEDICFNIKYCTKLFKKETMERIALHYKNIINEILNNPEIVLSEINMLSQKEKQLLLVDFNNTRKEYPQDKTIHELFEEQVDRTPDNTAVVFEEESLTYRELNEKANQLARTLREKGVARDNIVGIMVSRSLDMIVGIMGVLKAGGAYLPIDPQYPEDRICYMLEDSGTKLLLTQYNKVSSIGFKGEIVNLDDRMLYVGDSSNLPNINDMHDLVYVIYTSGSTGKPRGGLIENRNLVNLVFALKERVYNYYNHVLNIGLLTTYTFDGSVKQIFSSLLLGHALFIIPEYTRLSGEELIKYYRENSIEISDSVPTHLKMITDAILTSDRKLTLKCLLIGGDVLKPKLVEEVFSKIKTPNLKIMNVYGPTECCDITTIYTISRDRIFQLTHIPIGTPIANAKVYILGKSLEIIPIGVTGEIYIAGEGLGRGYLNRPELTAEKFIPSPFVKGEKIYKTGDLARWLPDGNIEFLGRADYQVKIRSFRIELAEVEHAILGHSKVKAAVVLVREDMTGNKYLCAYIVSEGKVTHSELKAYLSEQLPDYMVPSKVILLEELPLTSNGKLDRKALPIIELGDNTEREYVAPTNEVEEKLVEMWRLVLQVNKVGINDNFFELGGNSLNVITLISRLNKFFNIELKATELFVNPTIKELAICINNMHKCMYSPISPVEKRQFYPLSSVQKRLYALNLFKHVGVSYNMLGAMTVEGNLDKKRVEESFMTLIKRQASLRTSFELVDGEPVQRIYESVNFQITYSESCEDNVPDLLNQFVQPFDLSKAPLLRVGLIKIEEKKHILVFDMHHIISDGWSIRILINEFISLFEGNVLPDLNVQYKDFSVWQSGLLKTDKIKEQKEYWLNRFSYQIPILNMPTDYLRPQSQSFEGDNIIFKLDKDLSCKLNILASNTGTTLYMLLLAAYNVLLYKYTGQEDLIVGSPVGGRNHADLENIIGMFVNNLAIRNYPQSNLTFLEFLETVKQNVLDAFNNQEYQYEELVESLNIDRNEGRNPIFDTMFVLQDLGVYEIEFSNLKFVPLNFKNKTSKFDLTLEAIEMHQEIHFKLEYCTKIFKKETIERLSVHLINILSRIVENPQLKLSSIEMLSEGEKQQILNQFNNRTAQCSKYETLQELFEQQVERLPNNIAVTFGDSKITYIELNKMSNQLARLLRQRGVGADTIVGIMVDYSLDMIIGILGILKAGGAYLPIDPAYPQNRINYMLEDSRVYILLTQSHLIDNIEIQIAKVGSFLEIIDLENKELYMGDSSNLEKNNAPSNLAYVIYTSGSTGRPKGCLIAHSNIARLVIDTNYINITEKDIILQLSSYAFDGATFDIFGALLNGAKLVLINHQDLLDTNILSHIIKHERVSVFLITPALFNILVDINIECLRDVRKVLVGGDVLSKAHMEKALKYLGKGRIIQVYGPTETTVFATYYFVDEIDESRATIPIGKPVSGTQAYITDKDYKLQPVGVIGELCISGEGLGKGYLNNPELTEKKFVPNPFISGEKMYKTGDLAKWLPDGNIEFLCRADHQIKIRGYRIELGEIEAKLLEHEPIKEAVVIAKVESTGDKCLCAYITSHKEVSSTELRQYLSERLPDYMIPKYFISIDKIPLTSNGKVDRKALPEPNMSIDERDEYIPPQTLIEKKLASIWEEVLGLCNVSINDNFFALGGDSLKATRMVSLIHKYRLNIDLSDIFRYPTLKDMSLKIGNYSERLESKIIEENSEIVSTNYKQIYTVVENNDPYPPEVLNCFYRPMAILFESFNSGYFDLFLFYVSYYNTFMADGWFLNMFDDGIFGPFFDFSDKVLKDKFGLYFKTIQYSSEEDMYRKIKGELDNDSPMLIPVELKEYGDYKGGDKREHFFIVKGYNIKQEEYCILDNIHVGDGRGTKYVDGKIKFSDLYNMNQQYFKNYDRDFSNDKNRPCFWTLNKTADFHLKKFNYIDAILEYHDHLNKAVNEHIVVKSFEMKIIEKLHDGKHNQWEQVSHVRLLKLVYYDLLYKFFKDGKLIEKEKLDIYRRKVSEDLPKNIDNIRNDKIRECNTFKEYDPFVKRHFAWETAIGKRLTKILEEYKRKYRELEMNDTFKN